jgi:O-antigen/teichoic acid export membrane protein
LPASFSKAIPVVYIISIGSFINIFTGVNSGIIYYSKKYKIGLIVLFAIFILTTSLNFILIPIHGIIGAAIATTVGIIIHNVAKFLIVLKKFKLNPFTIKVFRIFPIIIICLILDFVIPHLDSKYLDFILRNLLFVTLLTIVVTYFKLFPEINKYIPKKLFKNS